MGLKEASAWEDATDHDGMAGCGGLEDAGDIRRLLNRSDVAPAGPRPGARRTGPHITTKERASCSEV